MDELSREQQDQLIRLVFDGDFEEYVMAHNLDQAYPNALWTLIVSAGVQLERQGIIRDFESRTDADRDWILNFFAPSKLWLRLEEAFPPFDRCRSKTEYRWGELLQFSDRDAIAELDTIDFRAKLRAASAPADGVLTRLPYQTMVKEWDRGVLSVFVDRGRAVQAFRSSDSPWSYILPFAFFGSLIAFIPVGIFVSVWAGAGLLALALLARKMLTSFAVDWVRKDALAHRNQYRSYVARDIVWARKV